VPFDVRPVCSRETGARVEFVKDEFEAFLECGIRAHGFMRLRCAQCAHEKQFAFSCKRRGFCPPCGARRMAEAVAYLVDQVISRVLVRQWVLSFPIPSCSPRCDPEYGSVGLIAPAVQ